MIVLKGQILVTVNEIAPRTHNSGHYTIEASEISQYENCLWAILSTPIGSTALKVPSAAMLNLLGSSNDLSELVVFLDFALGVSGASVHHHGNGVSQRSQDGIHDNNRQLGRRTPCSSPPASAASPGRRRIDLCAPEAPRPGSGFSHKQPLVGVIMGSESGLHVMLPAAHILDRFQVPYDVTIVSARRMQDRLEEYARSASERGLRVIVSGAGSAAHLHGMVAAMTALPVIGVPVKGSSLDGVDSPHSIPVSPYSSSCR